MKKILVSWNNEYGFQGNIVAYRNKYTDKIISKKEYDEQNERMILDLWNHAIDEDEKEDFKNFDEFRRRMLEYPDDDFEPLVQIIVEDDEDLEKYEPYILL